MPFNRPSLPDLVDRAITDLDAHLPGADARLRRSNLNVLARVNAGAAHGLYGYLAWLARQILPDTADPEILERHARIWLPGGRLPASYAQGGVELTGTEGTPIPAGTLLKRPDGVAYAVENEVTIIDGQAHVSVVADASGRAGNTAAGTALRLDSPIAGINAQALVDSHGITGGADIETDAALLARLLDRIQRPPQGGNRDDYITWAREASPAVTRAWCYPREMGDGTVTVRFTCDNEPDIIPSAALVQTVQDYIDTVRPVTADVFVCAPVPLPIVFRLAVIPNITETRAAVEAALRDLLIRETVPDGGNGEGRILLSHLTSAIALSPGVIDYELALPHTNILPGKGEMAVFGGVEWL